MDAQEKLGSGELTERWRRRLVGYLCSIQDEKNDCPYIGVASIEETSEEEKEQIRE